MTRQKSSSREWMLAIIISVAIAVGVRTFFFAPYEVHGMSMFPTLEGDELLIVNKWIYKVKEPEYGDIIVFHTKEQRDFIKRVIGLPGDRIEIRDGKVYRNGKMLDEKYINGPMNAETMHPVIVPKGALYVLGDNRNNSIDSRRIGPVNMKDIVGRAEVIILPLDRMHFLSSAQ
jgi:signal peptidase I